MFDKKTRAKAEGRTRVLILDGHSSHYSHEFLTHARQNNIIVLGYPPHCTHALQGLDVVCFAKMKAAWRAQINDFETAHGRCVSKGDFTALFSRAYNDAFDEDTIKAAFRVTGAYPFNPNIITEAQMKPSIPKSVKGAFPLLQPSPVRAVMAAFRAHPPLHESPQASTSAICPMTQRRDSGDDEDDPGSPSLRQTQSGGGRKRTYAHLHHSLFTPSKRIRSLYSSLETTESGSYLVSAVKFTSSIPTVPLMLETVPPELPAINWSTFVMPNQEVETRERLKNENENLRANLRLAHAHVQARDGIIEGNQAQLIIQNLHLQKTSQVLYNHENRKKSDLITLH